MVGLGLGLGVIQLGPMYEIVTQNFRDSSVTLDQVRGWALPYRRILTFLIPDFFGSPAHHGFFDVVTWQWQNLGLNAHGEINPLCPNCTSWDTKTSVEAGGYVGILPLMLAFLAIGQAIVAQWKSGRMGGWKVDNQPSTLPPFQPSIFIFAFLAIISLLFAFGTPVYTILFYGLPGWNQLHSPFRWIFPFTLSIAVLAGLGATYLDRWVSARQNAAKTKDKTSPQLAAPSFLGSLSRYLGWFLFWGGLAGLLIMLSALFLPAPFIRAATFVFDHSGLAQNAFADGRQFFGYQWLNFVEFFLMTLAAGAVLRIARCPIFAPLLPRPSAPLPIWQPLAIIIIALDLILAGADFNPAVDPALLEIKPKVVAWLETQQAEDPFFRINSFDTATGPGNKIFLANAGMFQNIFDVRGYDSIIPAQYAHFMQLIQKNGDLLFNRIGPVYHDGYAALDSALLDLLGVRYILTTVDIGNPNYALVYDDEVRVYENLDALPRAFVVYQEMPEGDDLGFALRSLNPRQAIILDGENNGLGRDMAAEASNAPPVAQQSDGAADFAAPQAVEITEYTPNQVRLSTTLDQPGWLVLADSYFPGWRAYATKMSAKQSLVSDEQQTNQSSEIELTIYRANGNFRAVYLEPGQWQVRFRYSPRSFQLGLYGSFLAFVTLLFLMGYWSWGKFYREHETDSPIKRVAKK